MFTLK